MNIGFFADDMSACHAAFLANNGFCGPDRGSSGVLAGSNALAGAVPEYLDTARTLGRHLMVALPLAQLGNHKIRSRIELAVVAFGQGLVGRDAALQAMAADSASPFAGLTPPWLLAASGSAPPHGFRTLPVRMEVLGSREVADIRNGCTCDRLHRRAIGLFAALRIAADDPYASDIDAADVAELLSADIPSGTLTEAEMLLRDDLRDLASELDRGPGLGHESMGNRRRLADGVRRTGNRDLRHPVRMVAKRAASQPAAVRHAADCPHFATA